MALADVAHLEVQDAFTGEYLPLSDLWKDKPVVLGFFRRFGCMLCRYAAVQLSTLQPYLDAAGVRLVAVGFEAVGLQAFVNGNFFSGDIYVDLSRACYRGLNLENLGFLRGMAMLLTDRRVASTLKEAKNVGYGDFRGDGMQLGATFVVGTDGSVLMEHRQKHFGDNPNLDEIRAAAAQAVNKTVDWIEMEMNAAREQIPGVTSPAIHGGSLAQPSAALQHARTLAVEAKKKHKAKGKKGRRQHQQQHVSQREQLHASSLSRTTSASTAITTVSESTEDVDSVRDDDEHSLCDMSPLCSPSLVSSPDPEMAAVPHSGLAAASTTSTSDSSLVGQSSRSGGVSWPGLMGSAHMSRPRFAPGELWSLRSGCCDRGHGLREEEEEARGDGTFNSRSAGTRPGTAERGLEGDRHHHCCAGDRGEEGNGAQGEARPGARHHLGHKDGGHDVGSGDETDDDSDDDEDSEDEYEDEDEDEDEEILG